MDGPNVNIATLRGIKESRPSNLPQLIDFGSCALHKVDGALRAAHNTGSGIMDFLAATYRVFKDVPSRRADYKHFSSDSDPPMPMKHCSTRWVGNVEAVQRIIICLPHLEAYVAAMQANVTEPQSASYNLMKSSLADPFLNARLSFFLSTAKELEAFLTEFQADSPKIPFLYDALKNLADVFMERLFKPAVLQNKSMSQKLHLVFNDDNMLPAKDVNIGYVQNVILQFFKCNCYDYICAPYLLYRFSAKLNVREQIRQGLSVNRVTRFREQCKEALVAVTRKIVAIPALSSPFLRGCAALSPEVMCFGDSSRSGKLMAVALRQLVELSWITGDDADTLLRQYGELIKRPSAQTFLKTFKRSDRLDEFLINLCQQEQVATELRDLISLILCLSHGQASVERGFSLNKQLLAANMIEKSVVAQRQIRDYIAAECSDDLTNFQIDSQLLLSARNARNQQKAAAAASKDDAYAAEQEQKRRKREQQAELQAKRQRLLNELAATEEELHSVQH